MTPSTRCGTGSPYVVSSPFFKTLIVTGLQNVGTSILEYTRMVHEVKKQKIPSQSMKSNHPRIELCKNYIFKHLHDKIQIKDIAQELELNPNYLTELFYKNEGITVRDFIMQEKIKLARNLLMYSKYSYSEIATNLGFCSQSHFGKNFKSITQRTPKQFRDKYGIRDYIQ